MFHHAILPRRQVPLPGREARRCQRIPLVGLVARIGDKLLEVIDISEGGMNLDHGFRQGDHVDFTLFRRRGATLALNQGVRARATVIWTASGRSGLAFAPPTLPLMKLIIRHTADRLGVEPQLLK